MLEWLSGVPGWLALGLVAAVVVAEPALLAGIVLPSVGASVFLGFLSSTGAVPLEGAVVTVAAAAAAGDTLAFLAGRRSSTAQPAAGGRLAHRVGRGRQRIGRWYDRAGPRAVPLARWVTGARTLVPRAAGAGGLSWPGFLARSLPSGALWAVVLVGAGHVVGASYEQVTAALGRGSGAVVLLALMAVGIVATGRWAGRHADAVHRAAQAVRDALPASVARWLALPIVRRPGALALRWACLVVAALVLGVLAGILFHGIAAVVRFSGLAALDGWLTDASAALGTPAVQRVASTVAAALQPAYVVWVLLLVAAARWVFHARTAAGRSRVPTTVVAVLVVLGLAQVVAHALVTAPALAAAAPRMDAPELFPLQLFVLTAAALTAAGLLTAGRPLPLRSAAVTVAALVALGTAAARVQIGWDRPSSAFVGLLVGALSALLLLSLRASITDARPADEVPHPVAV